MESYPSHPKVKKARLLIFCCQGKRFGFDAGNLSSIERLSGIYEDKEKARTIETHLGIKEHSGTDYSHALHFKPDHDRGKLVINVKGSIDLIELPADCIYPIPALVASRVSYKHLLALGKTGENFFFLLNA